VKAAVESSNHSR